MKILHTSDWHLGQKLLGNHRQDEHQLALDWLIESIEKHEVEALLVSGDIFDIYNPPNYAREQYFSFLKRLIGSTCRHIIITAGNHDSPTMLGASKEILQLLDVHVITKASANIEDEIVVLKDKNGELEAVVAAIPFLRDEDIRRSYAGQTDMERSERLKEAIYGHFEAAGQAVEAYETHNIPLLAMGHLYAKGAKATEKQDNIYVGNIENIEAKQFPAVFDYVALGHIHRQQALSELQQIRYSGSLIPLSFSETKDDKVALLLEFEGKILTQIEPLEVPTFRRLKTIEDTLENTLVRLTEFAAKERQLRPWVEVVIETDKQIPNLYSMLQDHIADLNLELLKIRVKHDKKSLETATDMVDLTALDHFDVFEKRCAQLDVKEEELKALNMTYKELSENWQAILEQRFSV